MTFVNKSPKWVATLCEDTPGPGSYCISSQKRQNLPSSCFVSKTLREEDKRQNEDAVGPGSYNLSKNYKSQEHNQAVFRSKIQRFADKKEQESERETNQMEKKFAQLLKFGEHQKTIPGKIVSINQRRQFQKKIMPQVLPSIPTNQSSFGYRYDPATKKLVQNQNPKIIFANAMSTTKEDFYFQRTQSYIGKGTHFSIQKKVKRPSPQLKHLVGLPDPTKYQPELKINLQTTKNKNDKGNFFISQKQRFQEPTSPREILKMQKLRRQFKDYIPKEFQIKDLQDLKTKQSIFQPQVHLKRGKSTQCFLSKIDRFNQKKIVQKVKERQIQQLKIVEKTFENPKKEKLVQKEKKKQPYDLGEPRFKEKGKQNLGPGYYEIKVGQPNAAILDQKQQRFKAQNMTNDMPGPGYYDFQIQKSKQKVKVPFSRYVCNNQREKNRFSSMQSLYEEVGKQLNYQCKVERQTTAKVKRSPEKHQKAHKIYKKDINRMKELVQ